MMRAYPDLGCSVTDAQEARRIFSQAMSPTGPSVGAVEDRSIGIRRAITVRIYHPAESSDTPPVIVYFHGGGFVIGSLDSHDGICRSLCAGVPAILVSVDYRLAPEHKFPAAVDDAYEAVAWVADHLHDLGADAEALAVAGDSAGGNLAAVTCLRARESRRPAIAFMLLIYPLLDFLASLPSRQEHATGSYLTEVHLRWFAGQYLDQSVDSGHPYVSPLHASSLAGLPPSLVLTAEFDPLRDEGNAFAARLERENSATTRLLQAGGMFHGFLGMADFIPASKGIMLAVCAATREVLW